MYGRANYLRTVPAGEDQVRIWDGPATLEGGKKTSYCHLTGNQHGLAKESGVAQGQPVNATASRERLSRGHISQDGLIQGYFSCPHSDLGYKGCSYPYPDPKQGTQAPSLIPCSLSDVM